MTVAAIIAVAVPLAALAAVALIDRRGRRTGLLVLALVWGVACTWLAVEFNNRWAAAAGFTSLTTLGAPIIEETCKSLALPVVMATRKFAWFVDGALLGLAAGTGFAIRENLVYLDSVPSDHGLGLALARVTSTNLMHAGCTAIVGAGIAVTVGRPLLVRIATGLGGLLTAMVLHSVFNRGNVDGISAVVLTALGVGVFAAAGAIVALGVPMSKRWATADMAARGIAAGEQAVMGKSGDVADLLDVFERRFGSEKTALVEQFITVQRRIGVLSHSSGHTGSNEAAPAELAAAHAEADRLRREIGLFAMGWLRSHLPVDLSTGMWATVADQAPSDDAAAGAPSGLWASLSQSESGEGAAPGGLFGSVARQDPPPHD